MAKDVDVFRLKVLVLDGILSFLQFPSVRCCATKQRRRRCPYCFQRLQINENCVCWLVERMGLGLEWKQRACWDKLFGDAAFQLNLTESRPYVAMLATRTGQIIAEIPLCVAPYSASIA